MKPTEIYSQWVVFQQMLGDPTFTVEQKLAMGPEFVSGLPPEQFCAHSKLSRDAVAAAMKGRLDELNQTRRRHETTSVPGGMDLRVRGDEERGDDAATSAAPTGDDPGPDARSGVSLANLVDSEEPPKQKKAQSRRR
jgi:hypothetical protein